MHHFHNTFQKSRVDHHRSFRSFAHLLVSAHQDSRAIFERKRIRMRSHVPWKIVASFTRAVLKLILIFLAFTRSPPSPHRHATTIPLLYLFFFLTRISIEEDRSNRSGASFSHPVFQFPPKPIPLERAPANQDSKPRVSTLVTRSTKADGRSARERTRGRRAGRKGREE